MILLVIASFFLCQVLGDPVPAERSKQGGRRNYGELVFGEHPGKIQKHPWLISLETTNSYFCGGSILSESVILTTAICASTFSSKTKLIVRAGGTTINSGGSVHEVVTTVIHEDFKGVLGHFQGNLALIKVSPPFQFDSNVAKVRLPNEGDVAISGLIRPGGRFDVFGSSLKETRLRVDAITKCEQAFEVKLDGHICASATAAKSPNSCLHSGDPLMDGSVLLGVTHFYGCMKPNEPEIFVNVFHHLQWIKKNLQKLNSLTQDPTSKVSTSWKSQVYDTMDLNRYGPYLF